MSEERQEMVRVIWPPGHEPQYTDHPATTLVWPHPPPTPLAPDHIRLECLRLAVAWASSLSSPTGLSIIDVARVFEAFVREGWQQAAACQTTEGA